MTRDRAIELIRAYVVTGRPIPCVEMFNRLGGYDRTGGWYDTAQHRLALLGYRYRIKQDDWARIGQMSQQEIGRYARCYEAAVKRVDA